MKHLPLSYLAICKMTFPPWHLSILNISFKGLKSLLLTLNDLTMIWKIRLGTISYTLSACKIV